MVTSRAVVGSSAISMPGSQARAMAIITRWRMPPDSSWGYCFSRFSGSFTPTSWSISSARALACSWLRSVCSSMASHSWLPMVYTGFSEVIGSWKMIETRLPRNSRICLLEYLTMSSPLNSISPPVMRPGSTNMRMME